MNWEAIGAVGEVGGAIAVVATLAYLAAQVRQNTAATRVGSAQALADSFNQINLMNASSDELARQARLFYEEPAALNEDQRVRMDFMCLATCRTFESALLQAELDSLDDQTKEMIRKTLQQLFESSYYREWWHRRQFDFTERFIRFVTVDCGLGPSTPT